MKIQTINQVKLSGSDNSPRHELMDLYDWFITNIKGSKVRIVSYLIALQNVCVTSYVGQTRIAKKAKISREHANRMLGELAQMGILHKKRRYNQTCIYTLHPYFSRKDVRDLFERILKPCLFLPVALLMSLGIQVEKNNYIYKKNSAPRETTSHQESIRNYIDRYDSTISNQKSTPQSTPSGRIVEKLDRKWPDPRRGIPMNAQKRIKCLKLTRAGEIKLSVFPPEAIEEANNQLRKHKGSIRDVFRLYCAFCKAYCEQRGIKIDWRPMFKSLNDECINNEAPGVNPSDPYEYEIIESIDRSKQQVSSSRPRVTPKTGPYSTATPPKRHIDESPETIERNVRAIEEQAAGGNHFAAIIAGVLREKMAKQQE